MSVSFSNLLTPTNWPVNTRILQDANTTVTVAMCSGAARANTSHIDLGAATPYPTTETINIYVYTGSSAKSNTGNNVAVVLQHTSANAVAGDGTPNAVAWANIPNLGAVTFIGNNTATAAQAWTFKLPPITQQFIRATMVPPAGATDAMTDANITLKLLF